MKGTRRGDFSRILFDSSKHYSAVRMQQGRVLLDSDWNAAVDIADHRTVTENVDVVGASGAPVANAGFGLGLVYGVVLGQDKNFLVIGGNEGCQFRPEPQPEDGFTLEIRLVPQGDGTVWSRWTPYETAGFEAADRLVLRDDRLILQSGDGEELAAVVLPNGNGVRSLVVSRRGPVTQLFADGELLFEVEDEPAPPLRADSFLIGAMLEEREVRIFQPSEIVAVDHLPALLDEVRLWSRVLTEEEVAGLARRSTGVGRQVWMDPDEVPGLLGYWQLVEGAHNDARDATECNHGVFSLPPRWTPMQATLSAGRYYVGGVLCENNDEVAFEEQPNLPGAEFPVARGDYLFYLDVWERSISAVEDPNIRERALGGPSTTTRDQVVAQVRYQRLTSADHSKVPEELPEMRRLRENEAKRGKLRAKREPTSAEVVENHLYRVEIHHGGYAYGAPLEEPVDLPEISQLALPDVRLRLAEFGDWRTGDLLEVSSPEDEGVVWNAVVRSVEPVREVLVVNLVYNPDLDLSALTSQVGHYRRIGHQKTGEQKQRLVARRRSRLEVGNGEVLVDVLEAERPNGDLTVRLARGRRGRDHLESAWLYGELIEVREASGASAIGDLREADQGRRSLVVELAGAWNGGAASHDELVARLIYNHGPFGGGDAAVLRRFGDLLPVLSLSGDGDDASVTVATSLGDDSGGAMDRLDWQVGQTVELLVAGDGSAGGSGDSSGAVAVIREVAGNLLTLRQAREREGGLIGDVALAASLRGERLLLRRLATFKWSRDNGAEAHNVVPLEGGAFTLETASAANMCLRVGNRVEVVGEDEELSGDLSRLFEVRHFEPHRSEIVLGHDQMEGAAPDLQSERAAIRVWSHADGIDDNRDLLAQGVLLARAGEGTWHPLEAGIQVNFTGDEPYRRKDFWWIAARAVLQNILWPPDVDPPRSPPWPEALPPFGPEHVFAPVALLSRGVHQRPYLLTDLRRRFRPLSIGAVSKAGDVIYGDVEVRANVEIDGNMEVGGDIRARKYYGWLCRRSIVDTPHLVDGAVTVEKLAPEVGIVPPGYCILGPSEEPPSGYRYTGSTQTLFADDPEWKDVHEIESFPPGPVRCAVADDKIFIFHETGEVWEYDPERNYSRRRQEMPWPRRRFGVAAVGSRIYIVGGVDNIGRCRNSNFEFDTLTDEWVERALLPTPRSDIAVAAFGGRIHVMGGLRDFFSITKFASARHEVYEPDRDTWTQAAALPMARCRMAAAALGNRISVVGGERRLLRFFLTARTAAHHQYHPSTDEWLTQSEPLPDARADMGAAEIFGKLFIAGGRGRQGQRAAVHRYESALDHWHSQVPLHEAVAQPAVAAVGGKLYVVGARRSPDADGVLVEACTFGNRFYIHRREGGMEPELMVPGGEFIVPALPGTPRRPPTPDEEPPFE